MSPMFESLEPPPPPAVTVVPKRERQRRSAASFVPPLETVFEQPDVAGESEPVMSPAESWKSFGIRAFKTFLQGFFGTLTASGALTRFDASLLEAAAIGGVAAVVSFLNNWASAAEAPKATTAK